jgi:hypothetical protein
MGRRVQWAAFAIGITLIAAVWLTPHDVSWVNADQIAYQRTVELMQRG